MCYTHPAQIVEAGAAKALLPTWKTALLGLVAGFYIGFGALLLLHVGVCCPGLAAVRNSPCFSGLSKAQLRQYPEQKGSACDAPRRSHSVAW